MPLPLTRLLSDLVFFFVMRTILYFFGFCVRLHYFLYYLSFMFNQFFTKCIVSSPFSFFLCVKMSVWIVSNVSRVLHTFVNSELLISLIVNKIRKLEKKSTYGTCPYA